jgi:hypothetical protein
MNPRTVMFFESISRIVAGKWSVLSPGFWPLYWAINPLRHAREFIEQRQHDLPDGSQTFSKISSPSANLIPRVALTIL